MLGLAQTTHRRDGRHLSCFIKFQCLPTDPAIRSLAKTPKANQFPEIPFIPRSAPLGHDGHGGVMSVNAAAGYSFPRVARGAPGERKRGYSAAGISSTATATASATSPFTSRTTLMMAVTSGCSLASTS